MRQTVTQKCIEFLESKNIGVFNKNYSFMYCPKEVVSVNAKNEKTHENLLGGNGVQRSGLDSMRSMSCDCCGYESH